MKLQRPSIRSSGTIPRRQMWSGRLKRGIASIEEFPMARMTGGQAVVEMLRRHGIHTLFALPGVQNDALFGALYDAQGAIRVIHTRHEQGAAYMALGYARSTGGVGAYSVVPGPGVLNTTAA